MERSCFAVDPLSLCLMHVRRVEMCKAGMCMNVRATRSVQLCAFLIPGHRHLAVFALQSPLDCPKKE